MSYPAVEEPIDEDSQIRLLYVDDNAQFGELLADYLHETYDELTVITKSTASAGLELLDEQSVDCIVSDYQMPHIDGLEFLEHVREDYPNLPFILFTGKGSEAVAADAISAGVNGYLQKDGTDTFKLLYNQGVEAVSHNRSARQATLAQKSLHAMFEQVDGFFAVDDDEQVSYGTNRWPTARAHNPRTSSANRSGRRTPRSPTRTSRRSCDRS